MPSRALFKTLLRVSLTHMNKRANTGVKKANKATIAMYGKVSFPIQSKYIRFVHQLIHKLQLAGFGILTFPLSHLDKVASISSINPLRSITNTHKSVIISNFAISISNRFLFFQGTCVWVYG